MKRIFLSLTLTGSMIALSGLNTQAQDGEQIFKQNCSACHKMGMRLVGPDLTGVTEKRSEDWVKSFIKNSQAMVKAGDPDAVAIFEEYNSIPMTSFPLSDPELAALIGYIDSFSAKAETSEPSAEVAEEAPIEYTDEDLANGKSYFQGGARFSGGGPSCVACHNVTGEGLIPGGLMAKDLTNAFGRMGGHAGVAGILGAPPFPAMTNSYSGSAALTEDEIHALAAFLKSADEASDQDVPGLEGETSMLLYGFGGLFIFLILIGITWKGRLMKSVKHDIDKRQLRSI